MHKTIYPYLCHRLERFNPLLLGQYFFGKHCEPRSKAVPANAGAPRPGTPRPVPNPARLVLISLVAAFLLAAQHTAAQEVELACDRAAEKAEREANLPPGLLAAIGTVESGRTDASGTHRRAWPWSINAEGASYIAGNKPDALSTVRLLQARGMRLIDVGCFQVDLFWHPDAFASLEEAFDPDANARAASRILWQARFASTDWQQAIAAYHSASLLRGAWYLQRVLAVWPAARERLATLDLAPASLSAYVVMLSPAARLVRVITVADMAPLPNSGLPRVIVPGDMPGPARGSTGRLPRVLTPADIAPRSGRRL